jgi:hypothetical protein
MKTRMNVTSEIVTKATQGNSKRVSAAVSFLLVLFLQGIQLNQDPVLGQQGNIDPSVASQESANLKTSDSKGLIPIIPLSTLPIVGLLKGGATGAITATGPCGCREAVRQLTLQYDGATAAPVTIFDSQ